MKNKWFQIVIVDPLGLPGESVVPLLRLFVKTENLKFCILNDIDGGGIGVNWFHEHIHELIPIEAMLDLLPEVSQFVWCDMFLFKEQKKIEISERFKYQDIIKEKNLTLRMVDNTYFYIYTTNAQLVSVLQSTYAVESCTEDYLENLEYPY